MHTSKTIYSFELTQAHGVPLLMANKWPWSVLQVVMTTPEQFDETVAKCRAKFGHIGIHDTDRTFCVIHLCSGDQGGKYPERHIVINCTEEADAFVRVVRDEMAQAVTWYYTNVIARLKNQG